MIWLLVLVLCGAVAVFGPAWVEIEEHATLADLLEKTTGQEYVLRRVTITTSKDEHSTSHAASLAQPVATFHQFGDKFVKYTVEAERPPTRNAFTVMLAAQQACNLPPVYSTVHNNKQLFFNDVITLLRDHDVGFLPDELSNIGIAFVNGVVDTLWYIDGQFDKIQSRCDHGSVPPIPDLWLRFRKESVNKGSYNDWLQ